MDVVLTDTVHRLKQIIQDQVGTPPDQQRLMFDGYHLQDSRKLREYGIKPEGTVHLLLRLRGG